MLGLLVLDSIMFDMCGCLLVVGLPDGSLCV